QRARLIAELRAKIKELEAAQVGLARKERLERELELARDVQQSVLPHTFPQLHGYHFAARYQSARMVGGDFYDVIVLDGGEPVHGEPMGGASNCNRLGIVIADVSDKGIPAALYMALTRSLLLAEARRSPSPREVLINVNRLLLELGQPNMFVTIFYGVLDRATRRLTYARGGHDRPLVIRAGISTELGGRGTMLGLLGPELFQLSEEAITLQAGDRLILYTDGLMDVMAPDGKLFTREQLIALLQTHAALPPDDLCAAVFRDLAIYQGDADQYDDTTLLVVAVE
ncbi:MAG: PP2C family protein-serine/threonine phosphatase, partial [Anaerolineae bacterium]|nr:PP2C family protein-serine/threonine phosphatase [Anaerolineae bacterium]